ncbi:MAG TPA: type II secretion system F family protein [Nocardioidaceae bacterium]|nr:type II secretion system F family protein [Nocardioidaceae bacterium]
MSPAVVGGVLGLSCALGLLSLLAYAARMRRPRLESRLTPYLRDLPRVSASATRTPAPPGARGLWRALLGPTLDAAARRLESLLGGAASIRRRLSRAGSSMTVQEFRVEQVLWGCAGFAAGAAVSTLVCLRGGAQPLALLLFCGVCAVVGVLARDYHLGAVVRRREARMLVEFPTVADLLALSVAAGEGPTAALDRVTRVAGGELSRELARVLAESRTGAPVSQALDALALRTGLPVVARFAEGFAVAIERGTPLSDVLHAQAADVREASRRTLIETGARKEVLMMVPVVFLVLPVTVAFAFWPGVVGLRLMTP